MKQLFTAWKKEDKDLVIIQLQKRFIIMLGVMCLMCMAGWISAPSRLTVYIPPDISNGATMRANQISNPMVYSFAYEVWQEINYWQKDTGLDYQKNINTYWSYLTPSFKAQLMDDNNDLGISGQLNRERFMEGLNGAAYNPANIKKLNDSTWEVDLKMHITEFKNNQCVKDVEILYPLKVVRKSISAQYNPYGLQLAGFVSPPVRLQTII